jgi:hypothetical protein
MDARDRELSHACLEAVRTLRAARGDAETGILAATLILQDAIYAA